MKASDYLRCPGCGKKGVTLRLSAEDCWVCRYCGWNAYASGGTEFDVGRREALSGANPGSEAAG